MLKTNRIFTQFCIYSKCFYLYVRITRNTLGQESTFTEFVDSALVQAGIIEVSGKEILIKPNFFLLFLLALNKESLNERNFIFF